MRPTAIRLALAALATCAALATSAAAQDVVGTTVVDGRLVELLSDGTWREAADGEAECRVVSGPVSFCGSPAVWRPAPIRNPEVDAFFVPSDGEFAQLIVEGFGAEAGHTVEALRRAVIMLAAQGTGVRERDVPVLETTPVEVDGREGETMVYAVEVDGLNIVANSMVIGPDYAMQAQSWTVGRDYDDAHRRLHDGPVSEIRIEAP